MAQEALKKLQEQLNCSICLDTYTDPKQLQCNHVFCCKCLPNLIAQDQQGQLTITCPICRRVTHVPANGVAGLKSALFHINHLLDIQNAFEKIQVSSFTQSLEGAVGGATSDNPSSAVPAHCLEHAEESRLFCETCGELICFHCAIKGGKHYTHDYELLKKAIERYKGEINSALDPMREQVASVKKALAQLDACCGAIFSLQAAIETNIHSTFRQLQKILEVRKMELIGQLQQITQRKLKELAVQRDQIETTQAQLDSCLESVKQNLLPGREREVLMTKAAILEQVKEKTTSFQPDMLKPSTEADITFSALTDITSICKGYGQISAPGLPDPSKCHATGPGLEVAVVGEKSTAVLQAVYFEGGPCKELVESLECELVSELTGTRTRGSMERRGQNTYHISYQPSIKGRHQLHIKVQAQHIRGSPFRVAAKSPVEKIGSPILTMRDVKPWSVAVDQRREVVVVTEWMQHCVSVFRPSGQKLLSFGTPGSGHEQFHHPRGVAVDGEGNILVADTDNHRIQKFTAEGQFLAAVGSKGSQPLQFNLPHDCTYDPTNDKVYVVDTDNHRVQVLNSDLTTFSTFGRRGSGKGEFDCPGGVACDSTGNVYVADTENHRIQVFTAEGKFLSTFQRCGEDKGELRRPAGVAIDTSGMVYISEWDNYRVSVFTSEGRFVSLFGREGSGPGELSYPIGLAVDDNGVVYVCDSGNARVQVL